MKAIEKVLIVGGGIGGQSTAIALRQIGIEVEIVEILPQYDVYGVGIIQQANALRALDSLGVADEAIKRGCPYGKVKMCTPTGHQFAETGTPPMGRFPSHNGISRRTLHDVLKERSETVGVQYRMGLTVDTITNKENGVDVVFSDGTTGSYDLLIGADGMKSKVRQLIFGDYSPKYAGLSVWRYAFDRPKDLDTGYIYFGKRSKVGLIPMTEDTIYIFVVSAEGADNPLIKEEEMIPKLKSYLEEYPVPMVQDLIDQITNPKLVNYRPLETLHLPEPWYKGNVLIIGDGAHATIPQLGSGAALAIEDAVVLAEEITKQDGAEAIFSRFMNRRLERCKMVVEASEKLGEWELMLFEGKTLPEEANIGATMGKTCMALTQPI
ncbi:monooxygenase [Flavobacterium franklandianum]|uniref:Monooxygenase n=1 Tax=Flavobacterium franklandianum TaxID=2594430 RepID=A0A553CLW4_9FLAO|nr:FAD-dependent monooxygenase [Flavobacterium franklandianum]TRX21385.1 monooxygenase [Flavobacterium franklandianum]TRX29969.1 monooxygenase [Flavobacterium franklandianum]